MKKSLLILSTIMCLVLCISGCGKKTTHTSSQVKIPNPWVEINDLNEINKQLDANFQINQPKGFKVEYMAIGLQSLIDEGTIKPSGKIIYKNGKKEITLQIIKCLDLFNYARINYEPIQNSSIHAFYDIDTKRIVYAQGEYTILIDINEMEQDFSLVGMVKLKSV